MKAKIATQTLSKSVADALLYLCNDLKLQAFQNVKATVTFLKYFNDLFDILNSRNKLETGFLGFLIDIESLKCIYKTYILEKRLNFILTNKLSQYHLELFFGAIRGKGGFNNNPSARYFEAAYKRLLVHTEITGPTTGNITISERLTILSCGSGRQITATDNGDDTLESQEYLVFEQSVKDLTPLHWLGI
nr:unnamed protein product [Callosobruchus analis]